MDPRHTLAASILAVSSFAAACAPALQVYSYVEDGDAIVQGAVDAFPASLKDALGSFDVVIVGGPITDVRALSYLRGMPAPGWAKTWDDAAMATLPGVTYVSLSNTRAHLRTRGMSALEEEAWHQLDFRHEFSQSATFRSLAAPMLRFYSDKNYGKTSLDTKYREIFADVADDYTTEIANGSAARLLRRAYPDLMAWYDRLFESLDEGAATCKTLKAAR